MNQTICPECQALIPKHREGCSRAKPPKQQAYTMADRWLDVAAALDLLDRALTLEVPAERLYDQDQVVAAHRLLKAAVHADSRMKG